MTQKGRASSDPPASAAWARAADNRRAAVATSSLKCRKPMPVRELHLHLLLIREVCYTDDVAHAADQRVLNLAQGCRQQVPPCVPH